MSIIRPKHEIRLRPLMGRDGHEYWEVTIDGETVGPALWDRETAQVIMQWLYFSQEGIDRAVLKGRIKFTFEEAIGLGMRPPKVPKIEDATAEVPALPAPPGSDAP